MNEYLSYPDSSEAEKHRNANKLGELDLKERKQRNMRETYIRVDNEVSIVLFRFAIVVASFWRKKNSTVVKKELSMLTQLDHQQ